MQTIRTTAVISGILLGIVRQADAVKTDSWTHTSSADFVQGTLEGTAVSSRGHVQLGPAVAPLLKEHDDVDVVNAVAASSDGAIFAATGPKGLIFRIRDGKAEVFAKLKDNHVFSLLFTKEGHLLAGTGGKTGRIFKVGGDRQASVFAEPKGVSYIWAMARAQDGSVFAATGPRGELWKIAPDGKSTMLAATKQKNLLCLAIDSDEQVYAGTDTDGLIYRIHPHTGQKFVLYDAAEAEVSAITLDSEGNLYASTADVAAAKPGRSAADSPAGQPGPPATRPATTKPSTMPMTLIMTAPAHTVGRLITVPSDATSKAGPTGTKGNAIYRIDTNGFVTEIFRKPVMILSLTHADNALYVGTGGEGRIYKVIPADEETIDLAKLESKEALSLVRMPDGRLIVGTANKAGVIELSARNSKKGAYTSPVLDGGQVNLWGRITWQGQTPEGTKITVAIRSGNVADEKSDVWDDWSSEIDAAQGAQIPSPNARFLQYRFTMVTQDESKTPLLEEVQTFRMTNNRAPVVTSVEFASVRSLGPKAAAILQTIQSEEKNIRTTRDDYWVVKWEAEDPNEDNLSYDLYFRQVGESRWVRFAKELEKAPALWNTTTVSDGRYELKVVARDEKDNPAGEQLEGSRISRPLLVDNTVPQITIKTSQKANEKRCNIEAEVSDALSRIVSVRFSRNSSEDWVYVPAQDDIYDSIRESVRIQIDNLDPGENRIAIRAEDDHGNVAYHTTTVMGGL